MPGSKVRGNMCLGPAQINSNTVKNNFPWTVLLQLTMKMKLSLKIMAALFIIYPIHLQALYSTVYTEHDVRPQAMLMVAQ